MALQLDAARCQRPARAEPRRSRSARAPSFRIGGASDSTRSSARRVAGREPRLRARRDRHAGRMWVGRPQGGARLTNCSGRFQHQHVAVLVDRREDVGGIGAGGRLGEELAEHRRRNDEVARPELSQAAAPVLRRQLLEALGVLVAPRRESDVRVARENPRGRRRMLAEKAAGRLPVSVYMAARRRRRTPLPREPRHVRRGPGDARRALPERDAERPGRRWLSARPRAG